jgi:uncharacterized protein (TIGR03435 family)
MRRSTSGCWIWLCLSLLAVGGLLAQRPLFDAFEVASIKATPADWTKGRFIRMQSTHEFIARNHTLKTLVAAAYNLSPKAILGGPAWVDSEHFDILARAPNEGRPNLDEQMGMLRKLLAERFKLTFHREEKELPVFALTAAKGGSRLKASTVSPDAVPEGPPPLVFVIAPQEVRLPGRYASMGELASVMQRAALDRPVIDKTGLAGRYDFDLEWTPDESQFGGVLGKAVEDTSKPGLFTAIQQQLGLRLEATRGPVRMFVFDGAERPSEN